MTIRIIFKHFLPFVSTVDYASGNLYDLLTGFSLVQFVFASNNPTLSKFHDAVASGQDVFFVQDGTTAGVTVLSYWWDSPLNGNLVFEFTTSGWNTIGDTGLQVGGYGPADCKIFITR